MDFTNWACVHRCWLEKAFGRLSLSSLGCMQPKAAEILIHASKRLRMLDILEILEGARFFCGCWSDNVLTKAFFSRYCKI